jgi:hypothetical protein
MFMPGPQIELRLLDVLLDVLLRVLLRVPLDKRYAAITRSRPEALAAYNAPSARAINWASDSSR